MNKLKKFYLILFLIMLLPYLGNTTSLLENAVVQIQGEVRLIKYSKTDPSNEVGEYIVKEKDSIINGDETSYFHYVTKESSRMKIYYNNMIINVGEDTEFQLGNSTPYNERWLTRICSTKECPLCTPSKKDEKVCQKCYIFKLYRGIIEIITGDFDKTGECVEINTPYSITSLKNQGHFFITYDPLTKTSEIVNVEGELTACNITGIDIKNIEKSQVCVKTDCIDLSQHSSTIVKAKSTEPLKQQPENLTKINTLQKKTYISLTLSEKEKVGHCPECACAFPPTLSPLITDRLTGQNIYQDPSDIQMTYSIDWLE